MSPASKMSSRSAQHGAVSVEEVDWDGKYVRLKNNSETVKQLLNGHVLGFDFQYQELVCPSFTGTSL